MTALLELDGVTRRFGGLNAVEGVSFSIDAGRDPGPDRPERRRQDHAHQPDHRRASGQQRPRALRRPATSRACSRYQIARLGLARTFQIVQPFPKMTVLENAAAGALFCRRRRQRARGPRDRAPSTSNSPALPTWPTGRPPR